MPPFGEDGKNKEWLSDSLPLLAGGERRAGEKGMAGGGREGGRTSGWGEGRGGGAFPCTVWHVLTAWTQCMAYGAASSPGDHVKGGGKFCTFPPLTMDIVFFFFLNSVYTAADVRPDI